MSRVRNRLIPLGIGILILTVSLAAQLAKPKYTIEEYNDFTAASKEPDSKARLVALEAFLQRYPQSTLRPFVYQVYLEIYQKAANWPKVQESADKFLALDPAEVEEVYRRPNQTDEQSKEQMGLLYYQVLKFRAIAFLQQGNAKTDAEAETAATLATQGLERLEKINRPANVTPEKWTEAKKQEAVVFHTVLGNAAFGKKDYDTAAREYKLVTELDSQNAFYTYRLGLSYLQAIQPQYNQGFWTVARAVALFPENQKKSVREFLISKLRTYQGFADLCPGKHVETIADELIRQAGSSPVSSATWNLPDVESVNAIRNELTVKRIFDELKAGGDQRELIWIASCGMELPDLPGKVLEVTHSPDNLVTLRLASGEEAADADIANVEVKVKEPPEAKNLKAGDIIRISGVLSDYQAEPFLLRMTEGRVNPEDIPKVKEEKPAPRRRPASR